MIDEMFNRERELAILQTLASRYPGNYIPREKDGEIFDTKFGYAELAYLAEHGLVDVSIGTYTNDPSSSYLKTAPKITAKGIDLLKNDGGLGAILNVITVKFHADVLSLLESKISQSPEIAQTEKVKYIDRLRSLPADATKHLVLKLMDISMENSPKLLPLLQNLLG